MDVSVMFLALLNLIGFETESGKELFVGLPTTLDLGFDRVTVRDVFHGLLFMAMEDDCKVFDPGLRVQCGVARSKDDVESGAGYRETFRWNIRGGPRVKIDVQVAIAVVTMPELEKLKTEVGGSTFRVVRHGTIFVRADSLEEFGEQSSSGLRSTAVSSWMVLGTPWMLLVVLVMDRTLGKLGPCWRQVGAAVGGAAAWLAVRLHCARTMWQGTWMTWRQSPRTFAWWTCTCTASSTCGR